MEANNLLEATIKSPNQVVIGKIPPVIIVGLPRSGSSYLAHVLSCMKGFFVFDDLYPYQKARALGITNRANLSNDEGSLKAYIESLTWQLRAKIKYEKNFKFPEMSWEDSFEMEAKVFESIEGRETYWMDVLEEWMTRLTKYCAKNQWGYKTPQDFLHMDELTRLFPGVKFVYVYRDPRKMMLSYKNLPRVKTHGSQDGESRSYHPIFYSIYWKKAFDAVTAFTEKRTAGVHFVKFEDLIANPEKVSLQLAEFLSTTVEGNVRLEKSNSSSVGGEHKSLTDLELRLCEKLAGNSMKKAGYSFTKQKLSFSGSYDLLVTSCIFFAYQSKRFFTDKKARVSISNYIKSVFSIKNKPTV